MKKAICIGLLLLTGCAGSFQIGAKESVSREEIGAAFAERDRALEALMAKVKSLEPQTKENKDGRKS